MTLAQLAACLDILGAINPTALPLHHAQVLLFIAERGSCTYREIETRFGLSNASVSRTVISLGEYTGRRTAPLGLVQVAEDPAEGRRNRVRLTRKGEAVIRSLSTATATS